MTLTSFDKSHLPKEIREAFTIGGTSCIEGRNGLIDTYAIYLRGSGPIGYAHSQTLGLRDITSALFELRARQAKLRVRPSLKA